MKLQVRVAVLAVAALMAGGALGQGAFGSTQTPKARWIAPRVGEAPSTPSAPRPKTFDAQTPSAPKMFEPYKPYQPPKPKSVYGPGGTTTHVPY